MRTRLRSTLFVLAALVVAALAVPQAGVASSHYSDTVASPVDGRLIHVTVYKPASASPATPAPVILQSHGWGGSRTNADGAFASWLANGIGVVSFDQRGHGATGGTAHVQNPDIEGQDVKAVIDFVASLDWVALDAPGDPVLGAIGGSYGGGYQLIGALTEIRDTGRTRFNALAPQITWNNLSRSLAPSDVPRTIWDTLLYAAGVTRLPDYVHQANAYGLATGTMANGEVPGVYNLKDRFYRNSPAWFADNGYQLDIPVLFGQGTSDNLFPMNEAYHNFVGVLTPAARAQSIFIGYNGGHVLPQVLPPATVTAGDACSGGFEALTISFFKRAFAGQDTSTLQPKPYNVTSATGQCLRVDSLDTYSAYSVGDVVTSSTVGAPLQYKIADGPITVVGVPVLRGSLTAPSPESRAFFAIAVGDSPQNARVLQNNVMPLRSRLPAVQQPVSLELAGVAIEVPAGQSLWLTASAVSDMFAGTSRVPGAIVLENATVDLPVAP